MTQNRWLQAFLLLGLILLSFFLLKDESWKKNRNAYYYYKMGQEDHRCFQTFKNLFKSQTLKILVVFGYKDVRPERFVGDRYERINFIQRLVEACPERHVIDTRACGFRRSKNDGTLFLRQVKGPQGQLVDIELKVINSAAGPDDQENRSDPFQAWMSSEAKSSFLQGLQGAYPIVLYYGHSRDGGGPDFAPPLLKKDNHVDYVYYKIKKPGLKDMIRSLKASSRSPLLLGLYSCIATEHFNRQLEEASPFTSLITSSELVYVKHAIESLYQTTNAILGMKCENEFRRLVRGDQASGSIHMSGLFTQ